MGRVGADPHRHLDGGRRTGTSGVAAAASEWGPRGSRRESRPVGGPLPHLTCVSHRRCSSPLAGRDRLRRSRPQRGRAGLCSVLRGPVDIRLDANTRPLEEEGCADRLAAIRATPVASPGPTSASPHRLQAHRFRKHAAGVMGGAQPRAIVLYSPTFWTASVRSSSQPCWAVVRRLVRNASAARSGRMRRCGSASRLRRTA